MQIKTTEFKKKCFSCHLEKNSSEMQEIGVWLCNECLDKTKPSVTVKTSKSKKDEK